MATWNVELQRRGPGLLLAEIEQGESQQIAAIAKVVAEVSPDILLLQSVDYDAGLLSLGKLAEALEAAGAPYPHQFARRPNTGLQTGLDMDGDGQLGGPRDAQGFGYFSGQGGMAILSRLPILSEEVRDFSTFLWRDLPGALLPEADGTPFPSEEALRSQRLSTTAHWAVPVALPSGVRMTLLTWHATPPVFDGPEDRNGRRNHDEAAFWAALLDGRLSETAPAPPFILLGDANLDPVDGDGRKAALRTLLDHPLLQDPEPRSLGGMAAAAQGGANVTHQGDPALDTADWDDDDPGNLRVDYVLPSYDLEVVGSGVYWPGPDDPMAETAEMASRHRLVWVDVTLP